ncbi:MAG: crotonase/enoyl-CoA hydratase family protein [Burkholderiales bacterium]|nr:crotonase/enoyl-CoA hydratase family protein [Burkholderiales bacterium]
MSILVSNPAPGITSIVIDRPEHRNAVDAATAAALLAAFEAFDRDPAMAVAVFSGSGGTFCAGADLKAVASGELAPIREDGPGPMGPTRLQLSKPVIAAVEGHAVAGGLELAIWADMRVAAQGARFGVYCRRFGVPLVDLGTIRLPRLIGHGRAMDMILTGRTVDADEALRFGLVDRVVPDGSALAAALELAEQLAKLPQRCLRNDRLSAIRQWDLPTDEAMRFELRQGLDTLASGETVAGASRFNAGAGRHGTST